MPTVASTARTDLAGALSIGAGVVHAAAAGTHSGATTLVWLFTASAIAQVGIGVLVLTNPGRRTLIVATGVNLVCVGGWIASRTTGIPFIADLAAREVVGTQDLLCALLGGTAVVVALWALTPPRAVATRRRAWLPALALLPAVLGVAAPHDSHGAGGEHSHGAGGEHLHAEEHADGASHGHGVPSAETATLAVNPVLSGADTATATVAQLETAIALVEETRAAVAPRFTDTASATAAGYLWIGDGRRPGAYQHYVNPGYLVDDVQLDPERIESLVFQNVNGTSVLVSTMYLLDPGQTMADVPDLAGELTPWHDHQNLCWDESGTKLAGVSVDGGRCVPAGTLRATPPMLHVWLVDNPCGPFAGVEGHGGGGTPCATHEH